MPYYNCYNDINGTGTNDTNEIIMIVMSILISPGGINKMRSGRSAEPNRRPFRIAATDGVVVAAADGVCVR